jgi:hypothetical protein
MGERNLYELAPTCGYVQVCGRRAMSELSPLCAPKQSSGRKQHGGLIPDGAGAARDQAPRLDRACQSSFQGSEVN